MMISNWKNFGLHGLYKNISELQGLKRETVYRHISGPQIHFTLDHTQCYSLLDHISAMLGNIKTM